MADLGGWGSIVVGIGTCLAAAAAWYGVRKRPEGDDIDNLLKDRDYWHDRARECEMSTGHQPSDLPRRVRKLHRR